MCLDKMCMPIRTCVCLVSMLCVCVHVFMCVCALGYFKTPECCCLPRAVTLRWLRCVWRRGVEVARG